MPSTLVATVGASTANTYRTQSEATAYLGDRLNASAWTDASSDQKDQALLEAAREMNLLPWRGSRVTTTQALALPRENLPIPDLPDEITVGESYYVPTDEIHVRCGDAQCELALEFLRAGSRDAASPDPNRGVKRKKVDVIETEWFQGHQRLEGIAKYPRVWQLLEPFLDLSSVGVTELVRT